MIKIRDAIKKYGDKTVVDTISVDIEKGKLTAFVGSNGAGKSTLISLVSRLFKMNGGSVTIDEKVLDAWNTSDLAKHISILRQSNNLNLRLSVRELVSFGRYPYSKGKLTDEDEEIISKALEYMEITHIEDRFIDELSGGQRQMAFIAMTIAQDTEYILLDEPLNNLDMKHSVKIMQTLRNLVDNLGKTVIIVIHDINFVSCYADNIVALKNGKMVKSGPTKEIITSEVLKEIFDMHININNIDGNDICVYYV